jgi:hypothetical protein
LACDAAALPGRGGRNFRREEGKLIHVKISHNQWDRLTMDHYKEIEQLANELSKAHGSIDAITAAFTGILQAMEDAPLLTAAVVENMELHRSFHEGLSEGSPFVEGFQRTQTYVSEMLETREPRRRYS